MLISYTFYVPRPFVCYDLVLLRVVDTNPLSGEYIYSH